VASVCVSDIVASAFRLGTPKSLAIGVAQWLNWPISSSVSGRMPWRSTARARTLRLGVDRSIASPSSDAEAFSRSAVDHDAAVAGHILGHLADHLHADVAAPGVLHAARRQQPERVVAALGAGSP
jgi:hypothetical protein